MEEGRRRWKRGGGRARQRWEWQRGSEAAPLMHFSGISDCTGENGGFAQGAPWINEARGADGAVPSTALQARLSSVVQNQTVAVAKKTDSWIPTSAPHLQGTGDLYLC